VPATWGVRRRLFDGFARLGLAGPALRAYELGLAAKSALKRRRVTSADGVPLPPARLRVQVGPAHADAGFFLRSGRENADLLRDCLEQGGGSLEACEAILDWGCGYGRILRHWGELAPHTRICGCDINPQAVAWCQAHLGFAEVTESKVAPPFLYPEQSFDFVYALSVFTHLGEELQHAWIRECRRVLKPKGYLLFTTMGERYIERLNASERRAFLTGQLVVLYPGFAGQNICSAYHPREYVNRSLAADLEPVLFRPAVTPQDVYLFRKP
jgi:SAM-dependent methyltransferase